ncbi:hypothetical protein Q4595_25665, partial [Wenyingzhuangia sp. 1_MG-2023]|nr:hypothetical protein [Wenyingzhuangia sp. 1_MG-2023]
INQTELTFELQEDATVVTAVLTLEANNAGNQSGVLELQGQQLELLQLALDGTTLAADAYTVTDDSLTITGLAQQHQLRIVTRIDPAANTALEGLY